MGAEAREARLMRVLVVTPRVGVWHGLPLALALQDTSSR